VHAFTRFAAVPDPVSDFVRSYLTVGIFATVGLLMGAAMVGIAFLLRPTRPQQDKYVVYESGVDPVGAGWTQTQVRYYVYALLFVVFDVEAVFIFPWATRVEAYEWYGLGVMLLFIFVLTLPLLYAWKKGVLRWD
jgi:NADH-quinone oxidoreductase subunit A